MNPDQLYQLKLQGLTNQQISEISGLAERTIRERCAKYAVTSGLPWPISINQHTVLRPTEEIRHNHYTELAASQDLASWQNFLDTFKEPELKVLIINDAHFPNHDPYVLDIVFAVAQDYQPHVIIDGSDAFDNETTGRWPVPNAKKIIDAWESTTAPTHAEFRSTLRSIVPKHIGVFIGGNHDYRIVNYAKENAPPLADMFERQFVEHIRKHSLWLGYDNDAIVIGDLLITHGRAAGKYPAQKLWEQVGYNFKVSVCGHVHRKSTYEHTALAKDRRNRMYYKTSVAHTTGCVCKLPAYDDRLLGQNWSLGFGLATVDTKTGAIYYESIDIDRETISTMWGGKIYR